MVEVPLSQNANGGELLRSTFGRQQRRGFEDDFAAVLNLGQLDVVDDDELEETLREDVIEQIGYPVRLAFAGDSVEEDADPFPLTERFADSFPRAFCGPSLPKSSAAWLSLWRNRCTRSRPFLAARMSR